MKCRTSAFWRNYLDADEMSDEERFAGEEHLGACASCREVLATVTEAKEGAARLLLIDAPTPVRPWDFTGAVKPRPPMPGGRLAYAALAAVAVFGLVLLPPARVIAEDILQIFRVEKFESVSIDPQAMAEFDPRVLGDFSLVEAMPDREPSLAAARKTTGLDVSEPGYLPAGVKRLEIMATPQVKAQLKMDLPKFREYLKEKNIDDIHMPEAVDGATITAKIPANVIITYGGLKETNSTGGLQPSVVIIQAGLPEVEAPKGVDFDVVRRELLKLPAIPPGTREQILKLSDWKRTLPVPYPTGEATSEKVIVADGAEGVYLQGSDGTRVLMYSAGDKAYGVVAPEGSPLSRAEVFRIAAGLK